MAQNDRIALGGAPARASTLPPAARRRAAAASPDATRDAAPTPAPEDRLPPHAADARAAEPAPRGACDRVAVVILNGGSSAGKSSIARALQSLLPDPWLTFGVDTLVDALPQDGPAAAVWGITFPPDGSVATGPRFREQEQIWMAGVAAMARAGARIILDEVLLSGAEGQARWRQALAGLPVLWVGVRCDPDVAEAREAARGDRIAGMARSQAVAVHAGVIYDLEVDTTATDATACARRIAAHVGH